MPVWNRIKEAFKGYSDDEESLLELAREALSKDDFKTLKRSVIDDKTLLIPSIIKLPQGTLLYPTLKKAHSKDFNTKIHAYAFSQAFEGFSQHAFETISEAIAPNIVGMQDIKRAATLQLFADERLHILLLGDPGTGKTEILRSANHLARKSSMGLGSGTSGAGLSAAYAKGEMQLGLLPQADKGLCCIDELNLMKKDDRAALYNAMEKGFITYNKGGRSEKFSADVRVLSTANPKGDRFEGDDVDELKKQLPFDPALVSRFHFVFLIRKPDIDEFVHIAKNIAKGKQERHDNTTFYKAYIAHARTLNVKFPKALEPLVTAAAKHVKEHEKELLIEVSPRIVKGIIGFAKASARSELRKTVEEKDVQRVLEILGNSLGLQL